MDEPAPLRLKAVDDEDLSVFSAYLQDSIAHISEMAYLPSLHRFAMAVGRFRWEHEGVDSSLLGRNLHERVETGVHFDTVLNVARRNMPAEGSEGFLSLLSITSSGLENGNVEMLLSFSGGGAVRLEAECIDGYLTDMDAGWKTFHLPDHRIGGED